MVTWSTSLDRGEAAKPMSPEQLRTMQDQGYW